MRPLFGFLISAPERASKAIGFSDAAGETILLALLVGTMAMLTGHTPF